MGEGDGSLNYIENTGTSTAPEFVFFDFFPESSYSYSYLYDDDYVDDDVANPFDGIEVDIYLYSTPALGDFDNDGTRRPCPSIDKLRPHVFCPS